jgi:adenylate kinase
MSRPTIVIHNSQTDEIITREMNDAEYAVHLEKIAEYEARQSEAETKAAARQAILDRLGLSEEEARLLLG